MNLDNVLDLKIRMKSSAHSIAQEFASRSGSVRAGFASRQSDASARGIAFGIAPQREKQQYRLAVRCRESNSEFVKEVMASLPRLDKREIDVVTQITYRPRVTLRAGGSSGHGNITAGTLGAFVEDDKNYYMLSNNHVFADSDNAKKGDAIWQPGPADVQSKPNILIGHLHRWQRFREKSSKNIDAAIAVFSPDVDDFYPWSYVGIGEIDPKHITDRYSVARVVKRGRTTCVTKGVVSVFSLDGVEIDYGTPKNPRVITFDDQIEIVHAQPKRRPFSQGGDSGSLIIDRDTNRPYALLFAGGEDENGIDRTVANFIPAVLDRLKVRFVQ